MWPGLMPDSAWRVVCVINAEYYVYHNLAAPIQGPTDLSDDDDESDGDDVAGPDGDEDANCVRRVRGLAVPEPCGWIRAVHGNKSRLCVFKCMRFQMAGWASDFKGSDERRPLLFSSVVDLQGRLSRHERIPGPHYGRPGIGGNHVFNWLQGIHAG